MHSISIFEHVLGVWAPLLYLLLFVGMLFEGEVFLFVAIFLAHQGVISLPATLVLAGVGLLVGDFMWYFAGTYLSRFSFIEKISHKITGVFDRHLKKRPFSTIFISKFAYGIHRAVLLRAGQRGISTKTFARIIIISDVVWFGLAVGVATAFSASFGPVQHFIRYAELSLLVLILLFVFSERIIAFVTELFLEGD